MGPCPKGQEPPPPAYPLNVLRPWGSINSAPFTPACAPPRGRFILGILRVKITPLFKVRFSPHEHIELVIVAENEPRNGVGKVVIDRVRHAPLRRVHGIVGRFWNKSRFQEFSR